MSWLTPDIGFAFVQSLLELHQLFPSGALGQIKGVYVKKNLRLQRPTISFVAGDRPVDDLTRVEEHV